MPMLWIVLALLALTVAGICYERSLPPEERALIRRDRERRRQRRRASTPPPPHETFEEELARDPIGALGRYGTPEDAERLRAQGIDLEALGYRPPDKG